MAEEETQTTDNIISERDKADMAELLGYGGQAPDGKHNVHTFLHNVVKADDTLRLGNLTPEELGNAKTPVRALQHLALFANDIMNKKALAEFFIAESEIITRSSLSSGGFLIKTSITNKKELADVTPKERKENPAWYKSKKTTTPVDGGTNV